MGTCPDSIKRLIDQFNQQADQLRSPDYNEALIRVDYINPMFRELGWDMDNAQGFAEQYREVVHEDRVRVGGSTKAPDYSFRIGGVRKFFLEAKKPHVNIKENWEPAYQLRRYAWSAKLAVSLLTDFEEMAIYDCRIAPKPMEKPGVARREYFRYTDYPAKWDFIAGTFSKRAVLTGEFDRYCAVKKGRGAQEFDDAFLEEIEDWRRKLAGNLALRNESLDAAGLNFAVQRIIDRIIFLRICEDRGAEPVGQLQGLLNGERIYPRLVERFREADARYNSGLFHFKKEPGREESPDELTPGLEVDDAAVKSILRRLYYPESPYEFTVVSADILGSVYERFLGSVIELTPGHRAKIEPKPEVRKAGGVYYTPTYIVDYIVKQTVGKLLEGKTPREAAKLKVLDPACGSGSFLLGAYQHLLDWHLRWYVTDGAGKHSKGKNATIRPADKPSFAAPAQNAGAALPPDPALGHWGLTTQERKRILLDNVHGVDIDYQAVEVTKLSLLLRCLEGETAESIRAQMTLFHERALPDLGRNIQCGNSLIGTDITTTDAWRDLSDVERRRINPFDFERAFPRVFKQGGFDAVIGNPPYGALLGAHDAGYLRSRWADIVSELDTYALFMERSGTLLRPEGILSMIVPTGWYSGAKYGALRRSIASRFLPLSFVNLPYDIFKDAWVDTTVVVMSKREESVGFPPPSGSVALLTFPKRHRIVSGAEFESGWRRAELASWFATGDDVFLTYSDDATAAVVRKIMERSVPLADYADIQRGVTPFKTTPKAAHATSRPAFTGTVRRYSLVAGDRAFIRFDETLAEPKPSRYFEGPRVLLRELISRQFRLQGVLVEQSFVTNKSMQSILRRKGKPKLSFLLGVLNSRLTSWLFLRKSNIAQRDDFPKIVLKETRSLPAPRIDLSEPVDLNRHDDMARLVETMLSRVATESAAVHPHEKDRLRREIEATDQKIDQLVYQLYGLTDAEIRLVEEAMNAGVI